MKEQKLRKKALVCHSGGMDSSICLALAAKKYGKEHVLSLSFSYNQRHAKELEAAKEICKRWEIDHAVLNIDALSQITSDALTDSSIAITHEKGKPPNTLVVGRNGLLARLTAIHANHLGANEIYLGVIEVEEANSGYRDCNRYYMDLMEKILQIDFDNPSFKIQTPLIKMTKYQTLELAHSLGILPFLLEKTITCYRGIGKWGCQTCPACKLRNQAVVEFQKKNPHFSIPK